MVDRCACYFKELVDILDIESDEDMLFLFDEAAYVFTSLKERGFSDLAVGKIGSSKSKSRFINKYMEDYTSLSINQLDLVIDYRASRM